MSEQGWETANLTVEWRGRRDAVAAPFKLGPAPLTDLLPAARAVSQKATEAGIAESGRAVSCRAGCGACCRQLIVIPLVEAQALAKLVAALPAERQAIVRARFDAALARLEHAGLLGPASGGRKLIARDCGSPQATRDDLARRYFALKIACPFLEDELCSIHPDRPLVCREHHVSSPAENCARLYELGVDRIEPAARVGEALAAATDAVAGDYGWMIPLALSLEWAENNPTALAGDHDGLEMFQTFLNQVVEQSTE